MKVLKELKKNLPYFAVLFGLFALLLITCPAVSLKSEYGSGVRFSGLEVAFGSSENSLAPSAMILTYFMLLGSIACLVLSMVFGKLQTMFRLIASGAFFLTMILFLCSKGFLNVSGWGSNAQYRKMFTIGAGAALSAFFCFLAAAASIFDFVFEKVKEFMRSQVNKAAEAQIAAASVEEPTTEPTAEAPAEKTAPSDAE